MNWSNKYSCNHLPDDLGSSYADVLYIDLVPITDFISGDEGHS